MKVLFFIVLALATLAFCADQDFIDTCLQAHNDERAELGISGLTWSEDLEQSALKWAKTLARRNSLKHSNDNNRNRIGENIGRRRSKSDSLDLLLESWTSEKKNYIHKKYPRCSRTGDRDDVEHYTQIIWQETSEVGCGFATGFGRDYLVCQYKTSGNRNGRYVYDKENTQVVVKPEEIKPEEIKPEEIKTEETIVKTEEKEIDVVEGGFNKPVETKTDVKTEETKTEVITEENKTEVIKTETKTEEIITEVNTAAPKVTSFAQQCLDIHNKERRAVGSPDLTWSDTLEARATKWAKELARMGKLKHSSDRVHIGENISYTGTKKDSTARLLGMWVEERKYYIHKPYPNCSNTGDKGDVGHYTAMIWKATTKLGCAVASANGKDFMVCNYETSGNRIGKYAY